MKLPKKKKSSYGEHEENSENMGFAASATECTGLMPTPPENKEKEDSYRQLHSTEVPFYAPSYTQIKEGVYDKKLPEIRN